MTSPISAEEVATLVRCNLASQTANVPHSFNFHPKSGKLFFLGAISALPGKGKPATGLHYVDLPDLANSQDEVPSLPWHSLGVANRVEQHPATGPGPDGQDRSLTKEEELLRERLRMHSIGISFYFLHEQTGKILVPLNGLLFYLTVPPQSLDGPIDLKPLGSDFDWASFGHLKHFENLKSLSMGKSASDPKWSPDGTLVSFIRDRDIYVVDACTGLERRLTFSSDIGPKITSGVAEYIMQEEFDRYTGYWWTQETCEDSDQWSILYLEVDEDPVPVLSLPRLNFEGELDKCYYPRVGEQNARTEARIVRVPRPPVMDPSSPLAIDIATEWTNNSNGSSYIWKPEDSIKDHFPWAEYVARAGWIPTETTFVHEKAWFWLLLLNREQTKSCLAAFSTKGQMVVLREETRSKYWVNVQDVLIWLPTNPSLSSGDRSFIFTSEESGFVHLYQGNFNLETGRVDDPVALTSGQWMLESLVRHDLARKLLYFTATKESVLERHLYVVSYEKPSNTSPVLLTDPGSMHAGFSMDTDGRWCVCNSSSLESAPATNIFSVDHTNRIPALRKVGCVDNPRPQSVHIPTWPIHPPEFFSFEVEEGVSLHGCVYIPKGNKGPYPTILNTYGGPHVQYVCNDHRLTQNLRNQLLASKGYAVMMIDGRGSYRRGLEFEGAIHKKLGDIELADQMAAVEHLGKQGIVDMNRVAMSGWSYGGYMSLMALSKHPEFFKLTIAGAPVVRWEAYDTGYTERYLGLLTENLEGYNASSVLTYAEGLPEEEERLLVVHSLMDENVHFCHTSILVDALIQMNKPHKLVVFPKERHGLRNAAAQLFFERVFFEFIGSKL